jgi:putative solute:sodium symporter small subunit
MDQAIADYWRRNVRLKVVLLTIWAVVSIVLSILMINVLNEASVGGFPLGFWMAQQGSIFVFVILIFVYAKTMDRYDTELEATLQGVHGGKA